MNAPRTTAPTLLVGDDDVVVRDTVAELVASLGLRVVTASCGAESLQILVRMPIAVSILDIDMGDMTGIEVFERYVRGPFVAGPGGAPAPPAARRLSAIFMSAEARPEVVRWCETTGSRFLHKPFGPELMRRAIRDALERPSTG